MPNGIDLILADHQRVNELFGSFASTPSGSTTGLIVDALTAHDAAEHAALYPLVGHLMGDVGVVERAAAAHSAIEQQIERLSALEGDPLVVAVGVLQRLVEEHVADEERNILPQLAAAATPQQLEGLGARILQAKFRVG